MPDDDRTVKVAVVRGGGIGGPVVTTTLDSSDLDVEATDHLAALVDGATLRDRPPTGRADGVRVELAVTDAPDGTPRRARFDEHDAPDGARAVVAWVLDHPAARRSVGRRPS